MYIAFNRNNPISLRILNRGTYCILHSSKIGKSFFFKKITRVCVTLIEATLEKNIHVDFTCSWKCVELLQVVPTMWNTKIQVPPLSESCCSQLSGFANTPSKALTCSVASLEGKKHTCKLPWLAFSGDKLCNSLGKSNTGSTNCQLSNHIHTYNIESY